VKTLIRVNQEVTLVN